MDGDQSAAGAVEAVSAALIPRPVYDDAYIQYIEPAATFCPALLFADGTRFLESRQQFDLVQTAPQYCRMPPQWWNLEVYASNSQTDGIVAVRQTVPAWGAVRSVGNRATSAQILVHTGGDIVRLDIGSGNRFSFFSNHVNVQLEAPNPARKQANNTPGGVNLGVTGADGNSLLNNVVVMATLRSSVAPLGQRLGRETCTVAIAGAPAALIPIPDRSYRVIIYQHSGFGVPAPLNFSGGLSPVGSIDRGEIDFIVGVSPTATVDIPGNASFINTGIAVRVLTFVFEKEI